MTQTLPALLLLALFPPVAMAQVLDGRLSGLAFGDDIEAVQSVLASDCRSISTVDLDAPRFPLAAEREARLTCRGYSSESGLSFEALELTFADGGLAMVEARGSNVAALAGEGHLMEYAGFEGYMGEEETLVIDTAAAGAAWVVPTSDMHPHPFLGSTAIISSQDSAAAAAAPAKKPTELVFGSTLERIRETLVPKCARSVEFEISPPSLPTKPETQVQIDCLGFPYAGYTRKVEAVFGDGRLELVWILTGKPEEVRVREALIAAYGEPIKIIDDFEEFGDGTVRLRKDKPEVLFLSPEMASAIANE